MKHLFLHKSVPIIFIFFLMAFTLVPLNTKKESLAFHYSILTLDSHCDTPSRFLNGNFDFGAQHVASKGQVDIPRMEKGGLDAIFFGLFTSQRERNEATYAEAYQQANQMLDSIQKSVDENKQKIALAVHSSDLARINKKGKKAIYIGMENGFPLGTDIHRVEGFYDKGVRYITLSHSRNNDLCDSSTDPSGPEHNGLSEYGKSVVKEMNRLGMMVDVSHISDKAFYDVLTVCKAPVIASHSSVRRLSDHPRNLSDDMIKALAKNGGVIQICLLGDYISPADTTTMNYLKLEALRKKYNNYQYKNDAERKKAWAEWDEINRLYPPQLPTIAQAVDHIDYVVNLVGVDYVGIGSDFDGGGGLSDCRDVADFPKITHELLARGYSKTDIKKIWSGNFIRVFQQVENISN